MQGKGGKGNKKVGNSQTIVKQTIQRSSDEHTRVEYMDSWFTIAMQEEGEQLHNNFQICIQTSAIEFRLVDYIKSTQVQKMAKEISKA